MLQYGAYICRMCPKILWHTLKIDADKCEVIWLGTRQQLAKLSQRDNELCFPGGSMLASTTARNLGVYTSTKNCSLSGVLLSYTSHQTSSTISRQTCSETADPRPRHVTFRRFAGSVCQRLQRMQNSASDLICVHVKPLLQRLHSLPGEKRSTYKLCVLTFDVAHNTTSRYLNEMLIQCSATVI